jgi:tetratricopeptide (TPR) repeat protein
MSQFCTQCGTENVNDAKFCKSCGHSLIEKEPSPTPAQTVVHTEPTQEQEAAVNVEENTVSVENAMEAPTVLSGWLLLIPVVAWVLYKLGVLAGGNIVLMFGFMTVPNILAEALGGAVGIVGAPLIVTGLIYGVKKANGVQYTNFVLHTLIASIVLLAIAIAGNINTIRDEQKAVIEQTALEVEPAARPMTAEEILAADSVITATDAVIPAVEITSQEEQAFKEKINKAYSEGVVGTLQFPVTFSEFKEAERNCNDGQGKSCTALGQMYDMGIGLQGEKDSAPFYKKGCNDGDANGCNYLGWAYNEKSDYIKAAKLFKKACDNGSHEGCDSLGWYYYQGESRSGIETDYPKAMVLFKKACKQGNAGGCQHLGLAYEDGQAVEQDYSKATAYYKKACDIGGRSQTDGCTLYEKLQSQGY